MSGQTLQAIKFDEKEISLSILDQLLIPYQTSYIKVQGIDDGYQVIQKMQVRGAPAIAIVGCFSIVVELNDAVNKKSLIGYNLNDYGSFVKHLIERIDYLVTSRPTAVNLSNSCNDIKSIIAKGKDIHELYLSIKDYSITLFKDDLINNYKIGENGCEYIFQDLQKQDFKGEFSVMTICNTGSLATSGHGTALGIIRSLWEKSKLNPSLKLEDKSKLQWLSHVYSCETRPYNQGSRLTSYELNYEQIPFSLITDNMVLSLIESLTNHRNVTSNTAPLKYIIVGADRIVKNGDLANKIGTFQLSMLASLYPGVKFIGAAPITTIDTKMETGDEIVIEQRPSVELTTLKGAELNPEGEFVTDNGEVKLTKIQVATPGINVWNPAFDVTPHRLIDCIVTEKDYLTKDENGEFHLL